MSPRRWKSHLGWMTAITSASVCSGAHGRERKIASVGFTYAVGTPPRLTTLYAHRNVGPGVMRWGWLMSWPWYREGWETVI